MAVISFDLSSTLRCANTRLLALAQAETICTSVFLPASRVPHNALPSMATTSPEVSSAMETTQSAKPFSISAGSSAEITQLNVSWEGTPPGNCRKPLNQGRLALP